MEYLTSLALLIGYSVLVIGGAALLFILSVDGLDLLARRLKVVGIFVEYIFNRKAFLAWKPQKDEIGRLKRGAWADSEKLIQVQDRLTQALDDKEKLRDVLLYVADAIEHTARTGRPAPGGEQNGNSMHIEAAYAKARAVLAGKKP